MGRVHTAQIWVDISNCFGLMGEAEDVHIWGASLGFYERFVMRDE